MNVIFLLIPISCIKLELLTKIQNFVSFLTRKPHEFFPISNNMGNNNNSNNSDMTRNHVK